MNPIEVRSPKTVEYLLRYVSLLLKEPFFWLGVVFIIIGIWVNS